MANHECLTNSSDLPRTPTRVSIRDPRLLASSARTRNAARRGKKKGRGEEEERSCATAPPATNRRVWSSKHRRGGERDRARLLTSRWMHFIIKSLHCTDSAAGISGSDVPALRPHQRPTLTTRRGKLVGMGAWLLSPLLLQEREGAQGGALLLAPRSCLTPHYSTPHESTRLHSPRPH